MRRAVMVLVAMLAVGLVSPFARAEGKKGKLPHVEFDVDQKTVRVECEALNVEAPLEFFCCVTGTNEHESVLRTSAKPSDIQIGLLAVGLKPGEPLTYSEATNKWLPPHGPPLHLTVEYQKDGKTVSYPAYRWLRSVKTKKSPPAFTWVFTGSRVMDDGKFAADVTGYVVSICNFDLTLIDVPELVSSANETLEWERNADLMPKTGTTVWMVIEPVGKDVPAADKPAGAAPQTPKSQGPEYEIPNSEFRNPNQIRMAEFRMKTPTSSDSDIESADREPAIGELDHAPAGRRSVCDAPATVPAEPLIDVHVDQEKVDKLQQYWNAKVFPHAAALREAAEAHYKVISDLRREQQRLIDEADRVQRTIDKLEKDYQDMTTPRPEEEKPAKP